jgi:hypothetical protein
MPTFELRGWCVSHDVKFSDDVTTTVDLPARPTREQAEAVLFPLAWAELERWRGGADDMQFTSVEIDGSPA